MSSLTVRLAVLGLLVALALAAGLWRRRSDGRWRDAAAPSGAAEAPALSADDLGTPLGRRATLVQFSSAVCAPCRRARAVLSAVADGLPHVEHVEVDAEERLDLARRFSVMRTPTLLLLDGQGRVVQRTAGVPTPAAVTDALARLGAHADSPA